MIEIRYYECELCGKRFENEEECQAHERLEKMGTFVDGFTLYDDLYQPISFKDLVAKEKFFEDVFYVTIQNEKAGNALNDYIENELGYSFYREAGTPMHYPCVIGFWQGDCWQNLTEIHSYIETVLDHVS